MRFKLELKHRQTKLVQDYLFENQLDKFEHYLVVEYFQYSNRLLGSDSVYTYWVLDFYRRYQVTKTFRPLITSYLKNRVFKNEENELKIFHLLQFLSFLQSLRLDSLMNCKKHRIKSQLDYELKFSLTEFVKFTGLQISNHRDRKKLILYFNELQKIKKQREEKEY